MPLYAWKKPNGEVYQRFIAKSVDDLREITHDSRESDAGLVAVEIIVAEDGETFLEKFPTQIEHQS